MKKIISKFNIFILMVFSFLLTIYISLSSFEIVFKQDLPYIGSVKTFQSSELISRLGDVDKDNFKDKQEAIVKAHNPQAIKFKDTNLRLELFPAVRNKNQEWLEVSNKGNFIFMNENTESGIGNGVVYMSKDWRTISDPDSLNENDTFFIETESYTNMYRIVEKNLLKRESYFLLNPLEKPYIVIIIEDKKNGANYFVKAEFINKEMNT